MNILFIAPIFFDYDKAIKKCLDKRYDKVIFRCEIPFNSSVRYYALRRLCPPLAKIMLRRYNRSLAQIVAKEGIDRILIIRGYGLLPDFLETVRSTNPHTEIINYQWDSIQNNSNGLEISRYAHKNYSFDIADTQQYPQFKHIPLFYNWDDIDRNATNNSPKCDIFFIGSYYPQRQDIVRRFKAQCEREGFNLFAYLYMPFGIFIRKKLSKEPVRLKDVRFVKLSRQKYYNILQNSKVVLDIPSSTQTGATMRTLETLSMGKKLISTNEMLSREKFYNSQSIYIWNTDSHIDISSIVNSPFINNSEVMNIYEWLEKIGL